MGFKVAVILLRIKMVGYHCVYHLLDESSIGDVDRNAQEAYRPSICLWYGMGVINKMGN